MLCMLPFVVDIASLRQHVVRTSPHARPSLAVTSLAITSGTKGQTQVACLQAATGCAWIERQAWVDDMQATTSCCIHACMRSREQ